MPQKTKKDFEANFDFENSGESAGLVKDDKHNTRALVNEYAEEIEIDKRSDLFLYRY